MDRLTALFDTAELVALAVLVVTALAVRVSSRRWSVRRRRAFRCALAGREVEVEFEEWGLPGLRRSVVTRCSAFETPEAITCPRRCVDRAFRRQWEFALPVAARPEI